LPFSPDKNPTPDLLSKFATKNINPQQMNVLITGGAGYIGNELVFKLAKDPNIHRIVVLDNLSRKNYKFFLDDRIKTSRLHFINGDLLDPSALKEAMQDTDVVYHLAGAVPSVLSQENPNLYGHINEWGTAELVYAVRESNVKKVIYLSTASVYGFSDRPIDHNSPVNPISYFAKSMSKGELYVQQLMDVTDTYILRCADVYGYSPSARFESLINRFMLEVNCMGRIAIFGSGQQKHSFVHVDHVAVTLHKLIFADINLPSGIYNLTDQSLSVIVIAEVIRQIYPFAEILHNDPSHVVPQRVIKPDPRLRHLMAFAPKSLQEHLMAFKNQFVFSSRFEKEGTLV
jgi:UDP-glucose 4-epimerase